VSNGNKSRAVLPGNLSSFLLVTLVGINCAAEVGLNIGQGRNRISVKGHLGRKGKFSYRRIALTWQLDACQCFWGCNSLCWDPLTISRNSHCCNQTLGSDLYMEQTGAVSNSPAGLLTI